MMDNFLIIISSLTFANFYLEIILFISRIETESEIFQSCIKHSDKIQRTVVEQRRDVEVRIVRCLCDAPQEL